VVTVATHDRDTIKPNNNGNDLWRQLWEARAELNVMIEVASVKGGNRSNP